MFIIRIFLFKKHFENGEDKVYTRTVLNQFIPIMHFYLQVAGSPGSYCSYDSASWRGYDLQEWKAPTENKQTKQNINHRGDQ